MGCRLSRSDSDTDLERNAVNLCANSSDNNNDSDSSANRLIDATVNSNDITASDSHNISNGQSSTITHSSNSSNITSKMSPQPARPITAAGERSALTTTTVCTKPIGQVESASQADFFKMLDEKIAQGVGDYTDSEVDE